MSRHTPGPWFVIENHPTIRIHYSMPDGRESGSTVMIGRTALQFRAPRQGSHRGEKMVYRPFAEHDRADARLIAAAPELLDALRECAEFLDDQGDVTDGADGQPRPNRAMSLLQVVAAALANAEGRS